MVKKKKTPQNRVGHYVPTPAEVQEMREKVASIRAFAATLGPALSTEERMQLLRPRREGEPIADRLFTLGRTYGVNTRLLSHEAAQKDRELYESIEELTKEAVAAVQSVQDIYLAARSEYWGAALHFYGALSQMAETDASVLHDLEPIVEFFTPSTGGDDKKPDTTGEDPA